jgi:hypothetical protein
MLGQAADPQPRQCVRDRGFGISVADQGPSSPSESCAQAEMITAAAIVAAAWSRPLPTKSAVVLSGERHDAAAHRDRATVAWTIRDSGEHKQQEAVPNKTE